MKMERSKLLSYIEKIAPEDFFSWLDSFHKTIGLLPPQERFWKFMYLLLAVPHIFTCTFLLMALTLLECFSSNRLFKETMFGISLVALQSVVIIRTSFWILFKDKFEEIKNILRRDTFNFECFDLKKIGYEKVLLTGKNIEMKQGRSLGYVEIARKWKEAGVVIDKCSNHLESFRKRKMLNTRIACCFCYLLLTVFCLTTNILTYISELYVESYEAYNVYLNKTSLYKKYLVPMYLPFDTSMDGHYWFKYFFSFYTHLGYVLIFLPIESALTCSIIHLISQTSVVKEAFRYVDRDTYDIHDSKDINTIREFRIVKCITELQHIYRALEELEDFCSVQLMIQYGLATFLLCSICYVIPLMNNIMEGISNLIFVSLSLGQIFVFSYCCQTLSLEDVSLSVYNLHWVNYPLKIRSSLGFLIRRLQKPAHFTAGKIIIIDLYFFIQVIQKSYSFYTLITSTKRQK